MSTEAIILVLLSIIGFLISVLVTLLISAIHRDVGELKDMFIRHVRNSKIHNNMAHMPDEGG